MVLFYFILIFVFCLFQVKKKMNSDDDTVAALSDDTVAVLSDTTVAASIDIVAKVLFIGSCVKDKHRSTEHHKYRSPLNYVNWQVYSRNLVKFSTYRLFSHQS